MMPSRSFFIKFKWEFVFVAFLLLLSECFCSVGAQPTGGRNVTSPSTTGSTGSTMTTTTTTTTTTTSSTPTTPKGTTTENWSESLAAAVGGKTTLVLIIVGALIAIIVLLVVVVCCCCCKKRKRRRRHTSADDDNDKEDNKKRKRRHHTSADDKKEEDHHHIDQHNKKEGEQHGKEDNKSPIQSELKVSTISAVPSDYNTNKRLGATDLDVEAEEVPKTKPVPKKPKSEGGTKRKLSNFFWSTGTTEKRPSAAEHGVEVPETIRDDED